MSGRANPLRLVDADTGQFVDHDHPEIQALNDTIKGLERDVRTWIRRYEELKRDKDAEARDHKLWPVALTVFQAWQAKTGKKRCGFTPERFWLIEPFLRKRAEYGAGICLRAVAGRVHDHFTATRKNGSVRHFYEWERIFKDARELEESANRAPAGWRDDPVFVDAVERLKALNATAPHPKA